MNKHQAWVGIVVLLFLGATSSQAQVARSILAAPVNYFAPGAQVDLVLVSSVNETIELDVSLMLPDGSPVPLTQGILEPTTHLRIDLSSHFRRLAQPPQSGTVEVSFFGDETSVQGWLLGTGPDSLKEVTLKGASAFNGEILVLEQPSGGREGQRRLILYNSSPRRITYFLEGGGDGRDRRGRQVGPGQQEQVLLGRTNPRLISVVHDGSAGDLIAHVMTGRPGRWVESPTWTASQASDEYEVIDVPWASGDRADLALVALGDSNTSALIEWKHFETGRVLKSERLSLAPRQVRRLSFDMESLGSHPPDQLGDARIRIQSTSADLLVEGFVTPQGGAARSKLAFFSRSDAHFSGSYPLFTPDDFDSELSLLNLADEPTEIVLQLYWDGGTYSFGPSEIGPGQGWKLSVAGLVDGHSPDLLGRTLSPSMSRGFFKWKVFRGPRQLLGRFTVSRSEATNTIGFNCLGCCWEEPYGSILPSFVEFLPGQSVNFQACVTYDTCNGPMGPYPEPPQQTTVPSPFTWNGSQVSASSAAEETISFSSRGDQVQSTCSVFEITFFGSGKASACKALLKKSDGIGFWSASQSCTSQVGSGQCQKCNLCCEAQKAYWLCKKKLSSIVEQEYQVCKGHCATDHCS